MGYSVLRQLAENPSYCAARAKITDDIEWFDEALAGVTWTLCREPERGKSTNHPRIWAMPTDALLGAPPMIVYYYFDEQQVTLLHVEVVEEGEDLDSE